MVEERKVNGGRGFLSSPLHSVTPPLILSIRFRSPVGDGALRAGVNGTGEDGEVSDTR